MTLAFSTQRRQVKPPHPCQPTTASRAALHPAQTSPLTVTVALVTQCPILLTFRTCPNPICETFPALYCEDQSECTTLCTFLTISSLLHLINQSESSSLPGLSNCLTLHLFYVFIHQSSHLIDAHTGHTESCIISVVSTNAPSHFPNCLHALIRICMTVGVCRPLVYAVL